MAKKGGSQTVETKVDPQTQAYVDQMRRLALGYAGVPGQAGPAIPSWAPPSLAAKLRGAQPYQPIAPPSNPAIDQAVQQYGQYAQAGQLGLGALTGGPNPFYDASQQQALEPLFAQARSRALGDINQQATLASAFGGSRQGVAQGQALGTLGAQQAGFGYQAYQDSLQRALQAAQMGFGATGLGAFLPQQYAQGQLGLLNSAIGPYGQTQVQTQHTDPFQQLLGLGLTAGGFFLGGPAGAYAGNQIGQQIGGGGGYK